MIHTLTGTRGFSVALGFLWGREPSVLYYILSRHALPAPEGCWEITLLIYQSGLLRSQIAVFAHAAELF